MWSSGTERQGGGCILWVEDEVGDQGGQNRGGEKAGSERRWMQSNGEATGDCSSQGSEWVWSDSMGFEGL